VQSFAAFQVVFREIRPEEEPPLKEEIRAYHLVEMEKESPEAAVIHQVASAYHEAASAQVEGRVMVAARP
jgi:hypothetical protein